MKKTYIQPMTAIMTAQPGTLMAASGNATADLDGGKTEGSFTDKDIDVDYGSDESDAKHNNFNVWDED